MYKLVFILISIILFTICIAKHIKYDNFDEPKLISVKVEGYIDEPNTYELPLGNSFKDLKENLIIKDDTDLSNISNNRVLYNNETIVLEKKNNINKISINKSNYSELITLPGIGSSIASRIIEYREKYGFFTKLEEIMNVKGIGKSKYEKIREYICL